MTHAFKNPQQLMTIEQVKILLHYWIVTDSLNFHPDTPMQDYVSIETRQAVYDKIQADNNNRLLDRCFEICKENKMDIYELALQIMQSAYPDLFKPPNN